MSLTKIQQQQAVPADFDEKKFNEGTQKIKDIMNEYGFTFIVNHQVIIVPKQNDKQN